MERRLTAVLIADVAGYSRLVGLDEQGTVERLTEIRRAIVDPEIISRRGRVVKSMGDGILAEFPSAVAAVEGAVAILRALSDRNRDIPARERIAFRIGVNFGDVLVDGDDIFGDGVNVAARLETFARPGTVCLSARVADQVMDKVDLPVEDFGEQRFKNIADPVRVFVIEPADDAGALADVVPSGTDLPLPEKPSIAIMPFRNLSGDPQREYLAEGVRLHVQAKLIKLSGLFLIAPGTMAKFRDSQATPQQVAQQLGVRYILEGGVQCSGDRMRTIAELTDTAIRQVIWAEQYDCTLGSDLGQQDEIASDVVSALDVKLATGEKFLLRTTVRDPQALECFYRGLFHMYKGTKADNLEARHWFGEVVRRQPESPVGPTYMCFSFWADAFRGWAESREDAILEAARWAEKALSFDESVGTNGFAHIVLATVELLNRRYDSALAASQQAVARRSNCPTANGYLAQVLHYCGRSNEAIAKIRETIRLTPVYPPWFVTLLAAAYRESGDIERSIAAARHVLSMSPGDLDANLILCSDLQLAGRAEQARGLAGKIRAERPDFTVSAYFENQPYMDEAVARHLISSLRSAGLPLH